MYVRPWKNSMKVLGCSWIPSAAQIITVQGFTSQYFVRVIMDAFNSLDARLGSKTIEHMLMYMVFEDSKQRNRNLFICMDRVTWEQDKEKYAIVFSTTKRAEATSYLPSTEVMLIIKCLNGGNTKIIGLFLKEASHCCKPTRCDNILSNLWGLLTMK